MRWLSSLVLALMVLLAVVADWLPEVALFGRDRMGHNQLQQLAFGARTSLVVGLGATLVALLVGGTLGLVAGMDSSNPLRIPRWLALALPVLALTGWFYGFRVWAGLPPDILPHPLARVRITVLIISILTFVFRGLARGFRALRQQVRLPVAQGVVAVAAVLDALPPLLVVLALSSVATAGWLSALLIIGLTGWTGIARLTQLTVRQTLAMPYIEAAQVAGVPPWRIAWRHLWPAVARLLMPLIPVSVAGAILAEGTLSFLGQGVGDQQVSWGGMLSHALHAYQGWPIALQAGMAIFSTVLALNAIARYWSPKDPT